MGLTTVTPASKLLRSHKLQEQRGNRTLPGPGWTRSGVAFLPYFLHHLVRSKQIYDRCKKPAHSPSGRKAEVPVGKGTQVTVRPISSQEEEEGGHERGTQLGQNRQLLNIPGGMRQMPIEFGHHGVQAIGRQMGVKPRKQQDGMDDEQKLDAPDGLRAGSLERSTLFPSFPRRLIKRIWSGFIPNRALRPLTNLKTLIVGGTIFRRATPAVWSRDGKSLPPDIWFTGLPGFLTENRSPEILLPPPVHQSLHLGVGFQLIGITRRSEERRAGKQLRSARDIYP